MEQVELCTYSMYFKWWRNILKRIESYLIMKVTSSEKFFHYTTVVCVSFLMFYFSKYTWDVLVYTHHHHTEAGEKGENWCDVSVFFLLVSGVKVESLWHFCVFVCLWWLVCVRVCVCVRERVSVPVDRTNLQLVKKLWLFTQQCGMW